MAVYFVRSMRAPEAPPGARYKLHNKTNQTNNDHSSGRSVGEHFGSKDAPIKCYVSYERKCLRHNI